MASRLQLSAALCALGLFVLVNVLLVFVGGSLFTHFKPVKDQGILFQACNSAIAEYRSKPPADIVLLGSSVLAAPMWSVDAAHVSGTSDLYHHHRCYLLEEDLSRYLKRPIKVVCMAIPGAMVSDLFLLADKVLQGHSVLVVALTPRDFMDDLLTGETRTAIFQSLVTPQDLPALGDLYFSSGVEKADFILNNTIFLYGKRWRYQQKFASYAGGLIGVGVAQTKVGCFLQDKDRARAWRQSVEEYKARYRHFNEQEFAKQVNFLDCLLKIAAQRKTKVILVNMPLTKENLVLMPGQLYWSYLHAVEMLADRYKTQFIDCQRDPYYGLLDGFYDTVHLNSVGGMHFVHNLCNVLVSTEQPAAKPAVASGQRQM